LQQFREQCEQQGVDRPLLEISTVTKAGVRELLYKVADVLDEAPALPLVDEVVGEADRMVYRLHADKQDGADLFEIARDGEVFIIVSTSIEKLMKRTNFRTEQSIMRFAHTMRKMGIDHALRQMGAKDGDLVRIGDFEFEFVEQM
jgi:GTP-binding protein